MTSMAVLWDDPEAAKLRELIEADVVVMEKALSNLQGHMLALKVMSKSLARERATEIARIMSLENAVERAQQLSIAVANESATGKFRAIKGKDWPGK